MSDFVTNYNYVGNTKISVSIKKNKRAQRALERSPESEDF